MDDKRYDEVKGKAATIMPLLQMANAMAQTGKQEEALKYFKDAYSKSVKVLEEYGDVSAAFVVYASTSGPLFRYYMDNGMTYEGIAICAADCKYFRPLHRQYNNSKACSFLLLTAQQTTIALFELLNSQEGVRFTEENPGLCISIMQQAYNFLYLTVNEMKNNDPEHVLLRVPFQLLDSMQNQLGLKLEQGIDVTNLGEIMDFLAQNLTKIN